MDTSIFIPESKKEFPILGNAIVERIVTDETVYIDYLFSQYGCSCRIGQEDNAFVLVSYYINNETKKRFMEVIEWSNGECERLNAIVYEPINEVVDA